MSDRNPLMIALVTLFIAAAVYLLDSLYAKRWLRVERKTLAYVAAALLAGVFGEVATETLYRAVFHQPLWHYQFLPVHETYTSQYSLVLWAFFGLHIYWAEETLTKRYPGLSRLQRAGVYSVESLLLESFVNVVWLLCFRYLIYFYTPPELLHITAFQNIPCYFGASWVILATAKRFAIDPRFFMAMALAITVVFLFFP